ncbi:MAG: hypothetical protein MO852_09890 [Candidatus Devosia euplotis]|nr:hypothetical protein [Candidatus Devosia euplotis]
MNHPALGLQPFGDRLEHRSMLGQRRKDRIIFDGMVGVHDLAILAAQIAEAAKIRNHNHATCFRSDFGGRNATCRSTLNQLAQRLHIVAQMIMDHSEVLDRLTLRVDQAFQPGGDGTGDLIEKINIEQLGSIDGAVFQAGQDGTTL